MDPQLEIKQLRELLREHPDLRRVLPQLWAKGCGALVGREGCNRPVAEPTLVALNLTGCFLLYRSVDLRTGAHLCFLCDRHSGDMDAVMQDMAPEQVAEQLAEAKKFCDRNGTPNHPPGAAWICDVTELFSAGRRGD